MTWYVAIAAAVTVAVTAKLMFLIFLSGKTISQATLTGRLIASIEPARQAFVAGWQRQDWRYQCTVWPCMLLSMAIVSLMLRWLMPALDLLVTVADKARFCLLVFGIGIAASVSLSAFLVMLLYYGRSLMRSWWRRCRTGDASTREEHATAPAAREEE